MTSTKNIRLHDLWGLMYVDKKSDANKISAILELYPNQDKVMLTLSCGTIDGRMEQEENNIHFFDIPYGNQCLGDTQAVKVVGSLLRTKTYKFNSFGELVFLNAKGEIVSVWRHMD